MSELYKIEAIFPYKTGVPSDIAVNDWYVAFNGATTVAAGNLVANAIRDFYTTVVTGQAHSIDTYLSNFLDRTHPARLQIYNVSGYLTGAPTFDFVTTTTFFLNAAREGGDLPLEVACVSSMLGTEPYESDPFPAPVRRRRGRIYLGPLNSTAANEETDGRPDIDLGFRSDIATAMENLKLTIDAITTDSLAPRLVVWSRVGPGLSVVTEGHINNEWDTQRRRGSGETARTVWP